MIAIPPMMPSTLPATAASAVTKIPPTTASIPRIRDASTARIQSARGSAIGAAKKSARIAIHKRKSAVSLFLAV